MGNFQVKIMVSLQRELAVFQAGSLILSKTVFSLLKRAVAVN